MRIEQANRAALTRVSDAEALKKADQNARETRFDGLGFGLDAFLRILIDAGSPGIACTAPLRLLEC